MGASAEFEDLLAECLRRAETEGRAAVEAACAAHPEHAARLREHVARLAGLGLFPAESDAPLPDAIGPYAIERRLGRGGMGVVYLARDTRDGRRVALKLGPAALERGERSSARFEREVRACAALRHPNLVPVLDVGDANGRPYYAMEYVPGATLAEVLEAWRSGVRADETDEGRRLSAIVAGLAARFEPDAPAPAATHEFGRTWREFACRAAVEVARALSHAHANGVVHRDVKPANVMIRVDGRALVFDLGLARVDEAPDITATGDFAGTPHYVAPEVARGDARAADARSDVFALGVTLYELLVLARPFDGPNAARVLDAIARDEPRAMRRRDPTLPRDLETIVSLALEKDQRRRYATMDELADDLERFLAFRPIRARSLGPFARGVRFARRRPALASAIALGTAVAVGLPLGLFVANRAISRERDRAAGAALEAREQARTSARVSEFLVDLMQVPAGFDAAGAIDEMLERGARRAESDFDDRPLVRAALFEALGRVHANEGDLDRAVASFDRSLALRERAVGLQHADTARVLHALGDAQRRRGRAVEAQALFERAHAALTAAAFRPAGDEARILLDLAAVRLERGDARAAADTATRAEAALRADGDDESEAVVAVLELRARARAATADDAGARGDLERARAVARRAFVPDLTLQARLANALADVLARVAPGDAATIAALRSEASLFGSARRRDDAGPLPSARPGWTAADGRALLAAFAPPWRAEWDATFQSGITALQTRDAARAEAAFLRCLALCPFDPVVAYDLACVRALAGDVEGGLAWLERAVAMDAGRSPFLAATIEADPDTAVLRADPRGRALLDAMRADASRATPPPARHVPAGLDARVPARVVVVLEDGLASTDVGAAWREFATETHAIVLRPTPAWRTATGDDAPRAWVASVADFARRPWAYEEPVVSALRDLDREHAVDRARVVLVGAGSGALVAFDLAVRAPGLFRGVVLVDGPLHASLSLENAYAASAAGLAARAVLARERFADPRDVATRCATFLEHAGFGPDRASVDDAPALAPVTTRVRATIDAWLGP